MAPSEGTPEVDTGTASLARVYDVMLGGKDNFDADRELDAALRELLPDMNDVGKENRRLLNRAVRWLAGDIGIDQFIDLGSGLPTENNTHEMAGKANPGAKVVYVDHDPAVCAYGRALLEDSEHSYLSAGDLTKPEQVLNDPVVADHLDLDEPIAVLQLLTLHHIADLSHAQQVMAGYVERIASGSYVVITHGRLPLADEDQDDARNAIAYMHKLREVSPGFTFRTADEVRTLFDGLELVEPGLVMASDWWPCGPRLAPVSYPAQLLMTGVARKP